jgi:hypothetical protein
MTSYLRKYVTALASAKDYIAQWSSDHVFSGEELIVPFPTLAIFDPDKHVWTVHIKAWVYLPFQDKSLKSYLPSLPKFLTGNKSEEKQVEVSTDSTDVNKKEKEEKTIFNEEDHAKLTNKSKTSPNVKVDKDKKDAAAAVSKENHEKKKQDQSDDENESGDDMYEEVLRKFLSLS